MVSADSHSARIWDPATQAAFTTIEPASPVNDVLVWPGSGLIMAACDAPRIEVSLLLAERLSSWQASVHAAGGACQAWIVDIPGDAVWWKPEG